MLIKGDGQVLPWPFLVELVKVNRVGGAQEGHENVVCCCQDGNLESGKEKG